MHVCVVWNFNLFNLPLRIRVFWGTYFICKITLVGPNQHPGWHHGLKPKFHLSYLLNITNIPCLYKIRIFESKSNFFGLSMDTKRSQSKSWRYPVPTWVLVHPGPPKASNPRGNGPQVQWAIEQVETRIFPGVPILSPLSSLSHH
jgi:hypothetical protein